MHAKEIIERRKQIFGTYSGKDWNQRVSLHSNDVKDENEKELLKLTADLDKIIEKLLKCKDPMEDANAIAFFKKKANALLDEIEKIVGKN